MTTGQPETPREEIAREYAARAAEHYARADELEAAGNTEAAEYARKAG